VPGLVLDREGIDPSTPLPHLLAEEAPPQAGPVVIDIAQARGASGSDGIGDDIVAMPFLQLSCAGHQQQKLRGNPQLTSAEASARHAA
jgi:hypothetical protein